MHIIDRFQNSQNIVCEYNRTDIAGETLRKIKPGSILYLENPMFHSLPLLHLKGYQPYSLSYCFLKVWTVFRHSFRLLFWKISQNDNIASSFEFCSRNRIWTAVVFPSPTVKDICGWYIIDLYIFKTTWALIIKNVLHVSVDITDIIWNQSVLSWPLFPVDFWT